MSAVSLPVKTFSYRLTQAVEKLQLYAKRLVRRAICIEFEIDVALSGDPTDVSIVT